MKIAIIAIYKAPQPSKCNHCTHCSPIWIIRYYAQSFMDKAPFGREALRNNYLTLALCGLCRQRFVQQSKSHSEVKPHHVRKRVLPKAR